jgi:hypothetical protein
MAGLDLPRSRQGTHLLTAPGRLCDQIFLRGLSVLPRGAHGAGCALVQVDVQVCHTAGCWLGASPDMT